MDKNTTAINGEDEWLTVRQVSSEYGYSLSTIYKFTHNNVIPHYKERGRLKFKRTEVDEWVKRGLVKSNSEIEEDDEVFKKYELVREDTIVCKGRTLYRIRALFDFSDVKAGDLGGYIESEWNLSNFCKCWVYDNAKVYGRAEVAGDAKVRNSAEVYGDAVVFERSEVCEFAKVYGNAEVSGDAKISWKSEVYGYSRIEGRAIVSGRAKMADATIADSSFVG